MNAHALPWYKEPWPWLVMAGPAIVVVASFITLWLAITRDDGLVAENYYNEGLAINRALERDARARSLGLSATAAFSRQGGGVLIAVMLDKPAAAARAPAALHLTLANATRAGLDRQLDLRPSGPGRWQAAVGPVPAGRWDLVLDAPEGWRLVGEWDSVAQSATLGPVPGEAAQ
jgi:hypothetical protein